MTREERIKSALLPILEKMREHGATDEMCKMYDNGFHVGAMWADAHPHWISVNDELPKEYEEVLAVANIDGNIVPFVGVCENGIFYYTEPTISKERRVTHWMPLPQPPKGDAK